MRPRRPRPRPGLAGRRAGGRPGKRSAWRAESNGDVVYARAGELVFKPRNQWHTFWNAGDEPARILEIISPSGFERFFEELTRLGAPDPASLAPLGARYGLEFDFESMPRLMSKYGLRFPVSA